MEYEVFHNRSVDEKLQVFHARMSESITMDMRSDCTTWCVQGRIWRRLVIRVRTNARTRSHTHLGLCPHDRSAHVRSCTTGTGPALSDKSRFQLVRISSINVQGLAQSLVKVNAAPGAAVRKIFWFFVLLQFSRTVAPETSKGPALIALMTNYNWKRAAMLTSANLAFYTSGLEIKRQLKAAGMTVYEQPSFEPNQVKNSTLGHIKRQGVRVVIFMAFEEDTHTVASCAKTEKMVSGWAWISMEERAPIAPMIGWLYFRPVLPSKSMQDFAEQVSDYTRTSFNMTIRPESVDLTYSAALHDAVMLYAHAATRMLSEGANLDNGHAVTEAMRTTTFQGVGKSILQLDKNGDRIESYEVMN